VKLALFVDRSRDFFADLRKFQDRISKRLGMFDTRP
jgi:hypothetical protein